MIQFNDDNVNKFISDLTEKCKHYGVELYIGSKKRVNCGGTYSSGYFDGINKKIAIAGGMDDKTFLSILVHEASHFEQWILNNLGLEVERFAFPGDEQSIVEFRAQMADWIRRKKDIIAYRQQIGWK
jgi:hypothetical protein